MISFTSAHPRISTTIHLVLFFAFCVASSQQIFAQIQVPAVQLAANSNSTPTLSSSLSSILAAHGATLSKAYPWAISEPALAWNNIECSNCDKIAVANELNDEGLLDDLMIAGLDVSPQSCETCNNPPTYNDPLHNGGPAGSAWENMQSHWQIESTQSDCAWDLTDNTLPPVRIAVVDQSIDEDHPDLVGKVRYVWTSPGWEKFKQWMGEI